MVGVYFGEDIWEIKWLQDQEPQNSVLFIKSSSGDDSKYSEKFMHKCNLKIESTLNSKVKIDNSCLSIF